MLLELNICYFSLRNMAVHEFYKCFTQFFTCITFYLFAYKCTHFYIMHYVYTGFVSDVEYIS